MRTPTAHERHRAHHIRVLAGTQKALLACACALAIGGLTPACAGGLGTLPQPRLAQVSAADYVAVPFAPRAALPEFIPPSPSKDAVWVDGSWDWAGSRYVWRYGGWVVPPSDARYARWVVVRREADGQLFFAPSDWKDSQGKPYPDRSFESALGPAARARPRADAPPPLPGGANRRARGGASPEGAGAEDEEE